ncbi:hypothetical protein RJ640_021964 [Escallonia rubra]|uniref:Reverse transcriptase Ty1/copia-type domain-containing protein n=1 Tax=Escallonia rubra TaxID=112253 RepID=A0AA88QZF7_9ASTE|nr:hypothetical protein RJ640_021964 [Escallonia rubra]
MLVVTKRIRHEGRLDLAWGEDRMGYIDGGEADEWQGSEAAAKEEQSGMRGWRAGRGGDDRCEMKLLQDYLAAEFEMKDLGQLKYFLGIEIARSARGSSLSQRKYVLDLLTETGMLACKPVKTPIEMNHRLGNFLNHALTDKGCYQRSASQIADILTKAISERVFHDVISKLSMIYIYAPT